jgi:uncharacterized membrane protein YhaH (DUF805 family)
MPKSLQKIQPPTTEGGNMENPYSAPDAVLDEPIVDETYQPEWFSWSGRIGRLRYLAYSTGMMMIAAVVIGIAAAILVPLAGSQKNPAVFALLGLLYIPIIVAAVAMARRRLNDLNHSGWLQLLLFIPFVGAFFGLYMLFAPGTSTANKYGPKPAKNSTGVVVAGLVFPLIFVIGILAAIAIPAYQQYVTRAKAASVEQVKPAND